MVCMRFVCGNFDVSPNSHVDFDILGGDLMTVIKFIRLLIKQKTV